MKIWRMLMNILLPPCQYVHNKLHILEHTHSELGVLAWLEYDDDTTNKILVGGVVRDGKNKY